MLPHKTRLERHLKQRCGELFEAEFDVLLYDLTSTYVEGAAQKNPMVRRGYWRVHRPDCEQMVIALIVNSEGFPFSYETFDGNRADVSTIETILRMVERKYGKARRIWVFDRGIVSEENLAAIRKRDGQYLVGAMEDALQRLEKTIARIARGRLKDRHKMERRLGKIQARHPSVNVLYEVSLRDTADSVRLFWQMKEGRKTWREAREGAHLLRTSIKAGTAEELWSKYMQLTEAEATFRAPKSALSIRPLFHQLEPRVKAHVMVAFLGYALWVTLKHLLKRRPAMRPQPSASGVDNAHPLSPLKALALLSTLQSADIVLPRTDGRQIRLRRITEPTTGQQSLLQQLGVSLPDRLEFNRKCSVDSAIA
jgi:transposase